MRRLTVKCTTTENSFSFLCMVVVRLDYFSFSFVRLLFDFVGCLTFPARNYCYYVVGFQTFPAAVRKRNLLVVVVLFLNLNQKCVVASVLYL